MVSSMILIIGSFIRNFRQLLASIWAISLRTSALLVLVVLRSLLMNIPIVLHRMLSNSFRFTQSLLPRTYVTFDKSIRVMGQASKTMEITNAKNTVSNFKRLIGRRYHDTFVQKEKELNGYTIVEGKDGTTLIEVNRRTLSMNLSYSSIRSIISTIENDFFRNKLLE